MKKTEDIRAYRRRYYRNHKEKITKRVNENQRERLKEILVHRKEHRKLETLNSYLKTTYGISIHDYRYLLNKQHHKCAICQKWNRWRRLDVDHDHNTGLVRGLLCTSCNTALGSFRSSPTILERAIKYVRSRPLL